MPQTIDTPKLIDLTNQGSYRDIDVSTVPGWTVQALDIADWGIAEVEMVKLTGYIAQSYSPAKVLKSGTDAVENVDDTQTQMIRLRVKVADPSKSVGRVAIFGKETQ